MERPRPRSLRLSWKQVFSTVLPIMALTQPDYQVLWRGQEDPSLATSEKIGQNECSANEINGWVRTASMVRSAKRKGTASREDGPGLKITG